MKTDVLLIKARNNLISAILTFTLLVIIFIALRPSTVDAIRAITASGLLVVTYFAFKGFELLNISKKEDYAVDIYTCISIEQSDYGNSRKVMFLQTEKKELFTYITNKNTEFIKDMKYEIYFKKFQYRTSNNVLAISLVNTKTEYTPQKGKQMEV